MNVLEKEIEDIVYESALNQPEELFKRGLEIPSIIRPCTIFRQFQLGRYGIIDLAFVSYERRYPKRLKIDIVELKKDVINYSTFDQSVRYRKGVESLINEYYGNIQFVVEIHLIGKTVDFDSSFCYLPDFFNGIKFYTYKIDLIEGIKFTSIEGYNLTKKDLNPLNAHQIEVLKKTMTLQIQIDDGK